jgi:pilus assembly protein CpaB
MVLRYLLYAVMALGLAGFGGVAWIAMHPPAPVPLARIAAPPPVVVPPVLMLTTTRALRAGSLLAPDDLAAREIAASTPDMIIDTPAARDAVLGGMIRHNLLAGAPLHAESVLRPMDRGFLAAVLAPGMLAVSIGVDPVSGAAGLIWPGDRVDLVLTQSMDAGSQPPGRRVSGETMLAGLRVIAIDQQLMQGAIGTEATERNVRTVTLEVTSAQAERVAVGARLGKLSLAVHAATAGKAASFGAPVPAATEPPGVTWAGDVSSALTGTAGKGADSLRLYSGPGKTEEVHF